MNDIKQFDTRKKREYVGFLAAAFAAGIVFKVASTTSGFFSVVFLLIGAFCVYEAIKAISSYNINMWNNTKHAKTLLFISCLFGGIGGIIGYYILKSKEN